MSVAALIKCLKLLLPSHCPPHYILIVHRSNFLFCERVMCLRYRTFQHSVYPLSPRLHHQLSNYVIQSVGFFSRPCVLEGLSLCVLYFSYVPITSVSLSHFPVGLNCLSLLRHTAMLRNKQPHLSSSPPPADLLFRQRDYCVILGDHCVTLLTPGLCMWEMCQRTTESCDWLAGHTPPTVLPIPLLPNRECSDARAR